MLRGQASLQALLGKEQNFKRKAKQPPKQQGSSNKRAKPSPGTPKDAQPAAKGPDRQGSGQHQPQDGLSECPVCHKAMPADAVDAHLDDCLPAAEARRHSGKPATRTVRRLDGRQPRKPAAQPRRQASADSDERDSSPEPAQRPAAGSGKVTSPFKARAGPRGGPAPGDADSEDSQTVTICTGIVGRRFRSTEAVSVGMALDLQHDDVNVRDENAVKVLVEDTGGLLGYIPREVAAKLCPLLTQQLITLTAHVQALGKTAAAPVPIQLQARPCASRGVALVDVLARLHAAAEAAQAVQQAMLQRTGSGTGDILRANFAVLVRTVCEQDAHLLVPEETDLLQQFQALPDACQALYMRLYQRVGPWFRTGTLEYSEVADMPTTVQQLAEAGFGSQLQLSDTSGLQSLAESLNMMELSSLLAGAGLLPKRSGGSMNKSQLVRMLQQALGQEDGLQEGSMGRQMLSLTGPCLRLTQPLLALITRLKRLFFLSEGADLSRFLVTDLGISHYPPYNIQRTMHAFPDRATLLAYEEALQHATALDAALEADDEDAAQQALAPARAAVQAQQHKAAGFSEHQKAAAKQAPFLLRFSGAWIHTAMLTTEVSMLEKAKQYQPAVDLLQSLLGGSMCPGRRGEWWNRLCLDLEHLGRPEQALEMAEAALADEWVRHGERLALQRRVLRLGKPPRRWRKPPWADQASRDSPEVRIVAQPLPNVLGIKSRFSAPDGSEITVEQLALQHYATPEGGGWTGVHCEGGVWATLFGLLLWDVLFAEVPDVFRHPFQSAPLDLSTPLFYPARKEVIEQRLLEIRAGHGPRIVRSTWDIQRGVYCTGINWDRWDVDNLVDIATCVGATGLAAVCKLLAEDHEGWSGGMPDLLLWCPALRKAKLSEVKGPRDSLSSQQRAWIAALLAGGVDCEVLKVVEPGAKQRSKARRW